MLGWHAVYANTGQAQAVITDSHGETQILETTSGGRITWQRDVLQSAYDDNGNPAHILATPQILSVSSDGQAIVLARPCEGASTRVVDVTPPAPAEIYATSTGIREVLPRLSDDTPNQQYIHFSHEMSVEETRISGRADEEVASVILF